MFIASELENVARTVSTINWEPVDIFFAQYIF